MADDYSDEEDFHGFSDYEEDRYHYVEEHENDHQVGLADDDASEIALDSDDELKDRTGFFDEEASEADSDVESEDAFQIEHSLSPQTLDKFMQLPLELREMIWKTYCPDLSSRPRVYDLVPNDTSFQFDAHEEDHYAPLRAVLAVHRETRLLGHKYAPDLITLPHGLGVAPCHIQRDLFYFHTHGTATSNFRRFGQIIPGARNVGLIYHFFEKAGPMELLRVFPDVRHIFIGREVDRMPSKALTWCVSGMAHEHHVVHVEDAGGLGDEEIDILTVWPDPDKFDHFEERNFGRRRFDRLMYDKSFRELDSEGAPIRDERTSRDAAIVNWGSVLHHWRKAIFCFNQASFYDADDDSSESSQPEQIWSEEAQQDQKDTTESQHLPSHRISVLPLARFMFKPAIERFNAMKAWSKSWDEWETSDDESEGDEEESELVWDDSLNDFLASEDEDDSEAEDGSSGDELLLDSYNNNLVIDVVGSSEADEPSTTAPTSAADSSRRARVRTIIIDSDSDDGDSPHLNAGQDHSASPFDENVDDEDDNDLAPPSRSTSHRNGRALHFDPNKDDDDDDDDDDDEDEAPQPSRLAARRRRRVAPSDDHEDEDDDDETVPQPSRRRARPAVESESDEDDHDLDGDLQQDETVHIDTEASVTADEDKEVSTSDDESAPPPKMSLAKRLRLEATAAAAMDSDEESGEDDDEDRRDSDEGEDGLDQAGEGATDSENENW